MAKIISVPTFKDDTSADLLPLLPTGDNSDEVTLTTASAAGVRRAAVSVGVVGSGHRPLTVLLLVVGMVTVKGAVWTRVIVDLGL